VVPLGRISRAGPAVPHVPGRIWRGVRAAPEVPRRTTRGTPPQARRTCRAGGAAPAQARDTAVMLYPHGRAVIHRRGAGIDGGRNLRHVGAMDELIGSSGQRCRIDRIVSYRVLRTHGLEERQIAAAVRGKVLRRLRRSVYISEEYWLAQKPWDQDVLRIKAHHAASNGDLVYSHASAARLWGLHAWNAPDHIHVIQRGRRGEKPGSGDVVRHTHSLPDRDVESLAGGIRVTSRERTVLDCARTLPFELAVIIADSALQRGASLAKMHEMAGGAPKSRFITRVRRVLAAVDGRSESAGETRLRLKLRAWNFPQPVLQHEIRTAEGTYRADFAWPELKLIFEFDGDSKYRDARPTDQVILDERKRETRLMEEGWTIVRVRWSHLDDEAGLKNRLVRKYNEAFRNTAGRAA
jgi:very-short-patch-repair endonuclease